MSTVWMASVMNGLGRPLSFHSILLSGILTIYLLLALHQSRGLTVIGIFICVGVLMHREASASLSLPYLPKLANAAIV